VAIAGPVDPAVFSTSEQRVDSNIKLLGYVSEGELRSLYENAAAFIHPSKYEGFGIPPIEAMALDCPVIASCAAAIPEVCGDAARYFSPDDAEALADIIRAVVNCPEDRETLIARGREQIQRHTWRASARCYLSIIERQPAAASSTTIDAPPSRAAQLAPMLHSPTAQASAPSDKNYANLD
jgi:glycosyltransferase involved in cell wall biosynthesis